MAEFSREKAQIQEVYRRFMQPNGDNKYIRQPFNLVRYDDGSGEYIEPVPVVQDQPKTWYDQNTDAMVPTRLIVDTIPFDGVTEIR